MSERTVACPVCGRPGFEIGSLPQKCPLCRWIVENLIGEPSKAYKGKLAKAQEVWQAGGDVQARAERLIKLFEQTSTAWKAGQWSEVLGCYDEILVIHPDNVRASRERPVALFCLMESLLQPYSKVRRNALVKENNRDKETRDNLQAGAMQFESVGMAKEADDLLEQAAALDNRIKERDVESKALANLCGRPFTVRYQKLDPESLQNDKPTDFASLLMLPEPKWTDEHFCKLLWMPFAGQLTDLSDDVRRHAEEFHASYDKVASELKLREVEAREVLGEAQRMIGKGCFPRAEACLAEAGRIDPSLSEEIASVQAVLTERRQFTEAIEKEKRQAEEALAEEQRQGFRRVARWVAIASAGLVVLLGLVWAWSNLIVPFFAHVLWQPFSWEWHFKLILGLITAGVGYALARHGKEDDKLPLLLTGIPIMLYGVALLLVILGSFLTKQLAILLASLGTIVIGTCIHIRRETKLLCALSRSFGNRIVRFVAILSILSLFVFSASLVLLALTRHSETQPHVSQVAIVISFPPVQHAVVNVRAANLRSDPGLSSDVIDVAHDGDTLIYVGCDGSWLRVRRDGSFSPAWIYSDLVTLGEPVYSRAPVRQDPDEASETLYEASQGEEFTVLDSTGRWIRIADADQDIAGWIDNDRVTRENRYQESEESSPQESDNSLTYMQFTFLFGMVVLLYSMLARSA